MLWIGDSTIRRPALGLYEIINGTEVDISVDSLNSKDVIDFNRSQRRITEHCHLWKGLNICRRIHAGGQGMLSFKRAVRLNELRMKNLVLVYSVL